MTFIFQEDFIMYSNFVFDIPTRALFGAGALNYLRNEKLHGKMALIATSNGRSVKKYGCLARVEKEMMLAGSYILFPSEHTMEHVMGSDER